MTKVPMTADGFARLKAELERLKTVERPAIVRAIAEARGHGDLAENAEYHAAKERQGWIESRMIELEKKLRHAHIVDVAKLGGDKVKFGATVVLADEDTGLKTSYRIVGADEADIKAGLLSITSPLARALIGKGAGESIEIATPNGAKAYEVVSVSFA
jgi:transcription elongation factor GreA